jgi:hypothetical protein
MSLGERQIESVLRLSGPERYAHFVKQVSDHEEAWGLFDDGWALAETDDGRGVLPLWPAIEYAELCATGDWAAYRPKVITIQTLLEEVLPLLEERNLLPGIFPTPQSRGVTPAVSLLREDLQRELARYE